MSASHSEPYELNPHTREALEAILSELDVIWPGYRRVVQTGSIGPVNYAVMTLRGQPFTQAGKPRPPFTLGAVRRIKWLLKRFDLLQAGMADKSVKILDHPDGGGRCFVHVDDGPQRPEDIPPPVEVDTMAGLIPRRQVSVARLALDLRAPLERVEAALSMAPSDVDADAWVREHWQEVTS